MSHVNTCYLKAQTLVLLQISYLPINMLIIIDQTPQVIHLNSSHYSQPVEKRQLESQSLELEDI